MSITDRLRELQEMRDSTLISSAEAARRARAILEREGMKPIDLSHFLYEKGYRGARLLGAVGEFGKAVKAAYIAQYEVPPMRVEEVINGEKRIINAYLELDRDLIEQTYEVWA